MPPPHTHFTIKAPSPTTIQYTVSTSRPPHTLPSQLLHYASLILRLIIGLFTILILLQKVFFPTLPPPSPLLTLLSLTHLTTSITTTIPWPILLPLISTSLFLVFRRFHAEESLLTLRTLGIQTSSLSAWYFVPATTRFIPTTQIRDIFIHEAFRGFEVRFYLCVVVEGEGDAVVVFPKILPKREIIEQVWRGARQCLYEQKG